jgi:hypothetical protein
MYRPVKIVRGLKNGHDLSTVALPLFVKGNYPA